MYPQATLPPRVKFFWHLWHTELIPSARQYRNPQHSRHSPPSPPLTEKISAAASSPAPAQILIRSQIPCNPNLLMLPLYKPCHHEGHWTKRGRKGAKPVLLCSLTASIFLKLWIRLPMLYTNHVPWTLRPARLLPPTALSPRSFPIFLRAEMKHPCPTAFKLEWHIE